MNFVKHSLWVSFRGIKFSLKVKKLKLKVLSICIVIVLCVDNKNVVSGDQDQDQHDAQEGENTEKDRDGDGGDEPFQKLELLTNLIGTTAPYGAPCDDEFEEAHVTPIYAEVLVKDIWAAKLALNEHIGTHPELASKSCYGVYLNPERGDYVENHLQCEKCTDKKDRHKTFHCCKCLAEEPMLFVKQPFGPCKVKESEKGDPCFYNLSQTMYEDVHLPFYKKIQAATTRENYVNAMVAYAQKYAAFYLSYGPAAHRLTCRSISNNLICSENEVCDCVNETPYFEYIPSFNEKYCIAKAGSVCNLVTKSEESSFDTLSKCNINEVCRNAVPGLYCDSLDDPDCNFEVYDDLESENQTQKLLYWGLNVCNGPWHEKPSLLLGKSFAFRPEDSLFISHVATLLSILFLF